jgi:hypothetical protein
MSAKTPKVLIQQVEWQRSADAVQITAKVNDPAQMVAMYGNKLAEEWPLHVQNKFLIRCMLNSLPAADRLELFKESCADALDPVKAAGWTEGDYPLPF